MEAGLHFLQFGTQDYCIRASEPKPPLSILGWLPCSHGWMKSEPRDSGAAAGSSPRVPESQPGL